jgi:hypothetical protein
VNGESIIMSISENDALWNNSTKQELAKTETLINTAIIKYKNETSVTTLAKEIGALLVLILMFVLISYLKSCFIGPLLNQTARRKAHPRNKIKNFILFDAKQQVNALLNVNTVLNGY